MSNNPYRFYDDQIDHEFKKFDARLSLLEKERSSRPLNENKILAIIRSTEFLVVMFCICLIISGIFAQLNLDKIVHVFHAVCFVFIMVPLKRFVQ